MNTLFAITFFLNIIFATREFFAVWDHIENTKRLGKVPNYEDYFEFWCSLSVALITLLAFSVFCFRQ
jgi:hypothetical protein